MIHHAPDPALHTVAGWIAGLCSHASAAPVPADLVVVDAAIATLVRARREPPRSPSAATASSQSAPKPRFAALIGPATRRWTPTGAWWRRDSSRGTGTSCRWARRSACSTCARCAAGRTSSRRFERRQRPPPGEWIRGRVGTRRNGARCLPMRSTACRPTRCLNAVAPRNPVALEHASGHGVDRECGGAGAAGIDAKSPDPTGGRSCATRQGQPTGWLVDNAMTRCTGGARTGHGSRCPVRSRGARSVSSRCGAPGRSLAKGVTTFHDAGTPFATSISIGSWRAGRVAGAAVRDGRRRDATRAWRARLAALPAVGYADHFLTVRAIKRMADGALGSRSALLLEPYSDDPATPASRRHAGDDRPHRRTRAGARLPAEHPRDRRPRQSRHPRPLRPAVAGQWNSHRRCAGASSTRSTCTRPMCRASPARRDCLHAGRARHLRRTLGAEAARRAARGRAHLRLARLVGFRRGDCQRHRYARRGHRSAGQLRATVTRRLADGSAFTRSRS